MDAAVNELRTNVHNFLDDLQNVALENSILFWSVPEMALESKHVQNLIERGGWFSLMKHGFQLGTWHADVWFWKSILESFVAYEVNIKSATLSLVKLTPYFHIYKYDISECGEMEIAPYN